MRNDQVESSFALFRRPPVLFRKAIKRSKPGKMVESFEPYPEDFPLPAGYYTFVLDKFGRLIVSRHVAVHGVGLPFAICDTILIL